MQGYMILLGAIRLFDFEVSMHTYTIIQHYMSISLSTNMNLIMTIYIPFVVPEQMKWNTGIQYNMLLHISFALVW